MRALQWRLRTMKSGPTSQTNVVRLSDLERLAGAHAAADAPPRLPQAIGSTVPGGLADDQGSQARADRLDTLPPEHTPRRRTQRARRGPPRDVPTLPYGLVQHWPVRFDGTGRGYARLWLGHVLLMVCTLGLAWPWVHRRTTRYFLRHTEVAGHRLDFDLPDRLLWPRLAITAALWLGLIAAYMGSFWTGMVALTVGSVVWPLVVYLQIYDQVGAITWAGRALWFDGAWSGLLRVAIFPVVLWLGAAWSVALAWHQGMHEAWPVAAGCLLLGLAWVPAALSSFYGYRQQHVRLGPLRLKWLALRRDFIWALGRAAHWALLWSGLAMGLALVLVAGWVAWRHRVPLGVLGLGGTVLGAVLLSLWWPVMSAALDKVIWRRSGNQYLRFVDHTPERAHGRLVLKNTLRLFLTLGAYWPWAVVSSRRMRWTHLEVLSRVDPEVLIQYWVLPDPPSEVPDPENEVIVPRRAMGA